MNARDLLKEVISVKGYSIRGLATKLGYSTGSYISERIRRNNTMRLDNFLEMIEAMDCEIIIKNKIGKKEHWVLTSEPKGE